MDSHIFSSGSAKFDSSKLVDCVWGCGAATNEHAARCHKESRLRKSFTDRTVEYDRHCWPR